MQTVQGKLSEEYQKGNIERWYTKERVEKDIEEGLYSYIARLDPEVVGVIGGGKTGSNTGEMFVLYVDESMRYKGIGKKLLEKLTQQQIEEGLTEQWVSVQEGNDRGLPFYEARGVLYRGQKITETDTRERQVSLRYMRRLIEE